MPEATTVAKKDRKTNFVNNYVSLIWSLADFVRDAVPMVNFNRLALPFVVLRRLECALEPTRKEVCAAVERLGGKLVGGENDKYCIFSKKSFYNTTRFTLNDLGTTNTLKNLLEYVNGFSPNARIIFEKFEFDSVCKALDSQGLLYEVCKRFGNYDLSPETVSDRTMTDIYEHLVERYGEFIAQNAEDFMTPRDVVRLAVNLIFANDIDLLNSNRMDIKTIYDGTAGTGGFISDALDQLEEWTDKNGGASSAVIIPYGQELESATWATGKANLLLRNIQGKDELESRRDLSENFKLGNTLSADAFPNEVFDYQLANPPYGKNWEKEQAAVMEEATRGYRGRFGAGTPDIGDGSLLFVENIVSKMKPLDKGGSKAAIVLSASPLFSGGPGSGPSNIRRWLFHNDLVESIIRLPSGIFFRTSITTYIWILSNKKPECRKNKILLIDASDYKTPLRTNLGNKSYAISEDQIQNIVKLYSDGPSDESSQRVKLIPVSDCLFRRITVERPLRMQLKITTESVEKFLHWEKFNPKHVAVVEGILSKYENGETHPYLWADSLATEIREGIRKHEKESATPSETVSNKKLKKLRTRTTAPEKASLTKAIRAYFGKVDKSFPPSIDGSGDMIPDPSLEFNEDVPWLVDVQSHFNEKIKTRYEDAWLDTTVIDDMPLNGEGFTSQPPESIGVVGSGISFDNYFYTHRQQKSSKIVAATIAHLYAELNIEARLFANTSGENQ